LKGDFLNLLQQNGYRFEHSLSVEKHREKDAITQGTTILAFKYNQGVLVAGDRRATAGNVVMHDRTDKVLEIDRHSVLAIAGVPATAFEIARILDHSFKYYRRSQLQDLSLEGKVRALSRLLKENIPMALQGIGAIAPIFTLYDIGLRTGRIYFYDILGAEFTGVEFATSGSGSPTIRGILHYVNCWTPTPLSQMTESEALLLSLRILETAAEFDSATGGIKKEANIFPVIKLITKEGIQEVNPTHLREIFLQGVEKTHV
jgi:proteasome beta subunit